MPKIQVHFSWFLLRLSRTFQSTTGSHIFSTQPEVLHSRRWHGVSLQPEVLHSLHSSQWTEKRLF